MQNLIRFPAPKRSKPTVVNWDTIESLRQEQYPLIPPEAVVIIKQIHHIEHGLAENGDWSVEFNLESAFYPPEDIECSLKQSDVIWLIDLLDRFGGDLVCGNESCNIDRPQRRLPAFHLNRIDPKSFEGIETNSECLYEYFCQAKDYWRILGKNLPDSNLILILIRFLDDEDRRYFGMADKTTFKLLLDRLGEGSPIEKVLLLEQIG